MTRGPRSARSTASRRPARRRSTRSADRRPLASPVRDRRRPRARPTPTSRPELAPLGRPARLPRVLAEHAGAGGRCASRRGRRRPRPRASGEMLEAAVVAGLTSRRRRRAARRRAARRPAVAYLTGGLGADLGVMISASHNPMPDNGIKLFAAAGTSSPDAVEDAIEARRRDGRARRRAARPAPTSAASADCPTPLEHYLDHLLAATPTPPRRPAAWSSTAPTAPRRGCAPTPTARAGATVIAIGAEPDGWNINDGIGSTHLDGLLQAGRRARRRPRHRPRRRRRPLPRGRPPTARVVDGDAILAICALAMHERGELADGHRRRHRDEQPRLPPRDARRRHRACGPPPSATATCSRSCAPAASASAASSPGTSCFPTTPPPATACSPRCGCWPAWPRPARSLGRARRRGAPAAAGAGQRAASATRPPSRGDAVAEAVDAEEAELGGQRPGAAAPVGHRAAGAGHGRGARPRTWPRDRRPPRGPRRDRGLTRDRREVCSASVPGAGAAHGTSGAGTNPCRCGSGAPGGGGWSACAASGRAAAGAARPPRRCGRAARASAGRPQRGRLRSPLASADGAVERRGRAAPRADHPRRPARLPAPPVDATGLRARHPAQPGGALRALAAGAEDLRAPAPRIRAPAPARSREEAGALWEHWSGPSADEVADRVVSLGRAAQEIVTLLEETADSAWGPGSRWPTTSPTGPLPRPSFAAGLPDPPAGPDAATARPWAADLDARLRRYLSVADRTDEAITATWRDLAERIGVLRRSPATPRRGRRPRRRRRRPARRTPGAAGDPRRAGVADRPGPADDDDDAPGPPGRLGPSTTPGRPQRRCP